MNKLQRTEAALSGKRPDRVPVFPIYDIGYLMKCQNKCVRDLRTATKEEVSAFIEAGYYLHDVDGYFVHSIKDISFPEKHVLEDIREQEDMHVYRNLDTSERFMMNAVGDRFHLNGTAISMLNSSFDCKIKSEDDIKRVVPKKLPSQHFGKDGYFGGLQRLSNKNPDVHFQFQSGSPFVRAIDRCEGYEAGLCLLLDKPDLMKKLMQAELEYELSFIDKGIAAGGRSVLFTSYFTGADTISPNTYRDMVYPYEKEFCRIASDKGLYVVLWFLGDTRPIIKLLADMPIDAIFLEQDRKNYGMDFSQLRNVMGEDRCVFGWTYENQFVEYDKEGIKNTFLDQFGKAGRNGAFSAGVTIMPEDADMRSMDYYIDTVRQFGTYE